MTENSESLVVYKKFNGDNLCDMPDTINWELSNTTVPHDENNMMLGTLTVKITWSP